MEGSSRKTLLGTHGSFYASILVLACLCSACTAFLSPNRQTCIETNGEVSSIALSPDGNYLATSTNQGVQVYLADSFQEVWSGLNDARYVDVALSKSHLFAAKSVLTYPQCSVVVLDAKTGQAQHALEYECDLSASTPVVFSPDGTMLASGWGLDAVVVWNVDTGDLLREISYVDEEVDPTFMSIGQLEWRVAWSPDSHELAFGAPDGKVIVWDVATGELLRLLSGHEVWVWNLAFSPDGTMLASHQADKIILWDMNTGEIHISIDQARSYTDAALAWSPDNSMLATGLGYKTVALWDINTGTQLRLLEGHSATILGDLAFSADGTKLISASQNEIIEWDVETGEQMHTVEIRSIAAGESCVSSP